MLIAKRIRTKGTQGNAKIIVIVVLLVVVGVALTIFTKPEKRELKNKQTMAAATIDQTGSNNSKIVEKKGVPSAGIPSKKEPLSSSDSAELQRKVDDYVTNMQKMEEASDLAHQEHREWVRKKFW